MPGTSGTHRRRPDSDVVLGLVSAAVNGFVAFTFATFGPAFAATHAPLDRAATAWFSSAAAAVLVAAVVVRLLAGRVRRGLVTTSACGAGLAAVWLLFAALRAVAVPDLGLAFLTAAAGVAAVVFGVRLLRARSATTRAAQSHASSS